MEYKGKFEPGDTKANNFDDATKATIIDKLKSEYFSIEKNEDLSKDQKISRVINYTAGLCAATAVQPIPFADIFILTPIQAYMGTRLAAVHGIDVKEQEVTVLIKQLIGTVGLGFLAQQLAIGAYKTVLPFMGAITTMPLVYGLTYAIGKVMDAYFEKISKGQDLSDKEMKDIWKKSFKSGKAKGKDKK